jgi:hypothetical protein
MVIKIKPIAAVFLFVAIIKFVGNTNKQKNPVQFIERDFLCYLFTNEITFLQP